ncbi:MAG: phosphopyruvate hydratase [Candidatus Staskawiczbacteria bacterium]|nr:phosphopyruvate hydratase [Candidatus Staskawiczbacteria bacterium]
MNILKSRARIVFAKGKEILDSRGKPTIEVELKTDKGIFFASVPAGVSTGNDEASELRDDDGRGVKKAIENINKIIAPKLKGKNPAEQKEIDEIMINLDGTENKSKLGANAMLAVSMAACRAGAGAKKIPLYQHIFKFGGSPTSPEIEMGGCRRSPELPFPMFNIIEGGKHADNDLGIQEFLLVCQKKTFLENLILGNKIFGVLKETIEKNHGPDVRLGDEGGFAPDISKTEQALYLLKNAIAKEPDAKIALDAASSQFYKNGKYGIDGEEFTRQGLLEFYGNLINNFPIISIEDPFSEDDWQGFEFIMRQMGDKILVVADDLTTTNAKKIREAKSRSACNAVIIKPNQIGTVSETIEAIKTAKQAGFKIIISHRAGETADTFIADLAVGAEADFIKSGSPLKEERMVKYKRLLEIEKELTYG